MTETYGIRVDTKGDGDILDLTQQVSESVNKSGISSGIVTVFVPGSTAGITTIEFEPGLQKDLPEFFEKIIPRNKTYHHDETWGDGNGFSHLRAALVGPSLTVPVVSGKLILGTWQQIVLLDFDNRSRQREIVVQVIGE
ncbi:MAG: secondary thiamine-phosphate synthase enzyme YjbQ [candidate division Zixibacteria bacterium]|nr:secondary thiamine-phosphate synthase enzyme YjbQ [candidate division Zixibacteria bacterium]MBU1470767.1 secondary thiamine-phosphate synthase enzyme YjbQ [candidate division Zixibacteria bacterium]MBU2625289.1 secondary thiamine-phosphate synthase enzyme YjbQ [candidate division Zixibacteria bacterium]